MERDHDSRVGTKLTMMGFLLFVACNLGLEPVVHDVAVVTHREIYPTAEVYEAGLFRRGPINQGSWKFPPDVRVCANAPITKRRVEKALDFWRELGYSFNEIYYNDVSRHCTEELFSYSTIIIDLIDGTHKEPALATTTTWIESETKRILKAKIVLKSRYGNVERILEHELGHAFGWKDCNRSGHIMNHNWALSGLDTTGLKNPE
jgi:hypothetical protein